MRLSNLLRLSTYYCSYGALFLCSFWVPFRWGSSLAPQDSTVHRSLPRTSELCGLALAPLPQATMAESDIDAPGPGSMPDRMLLRLDVPLPPLAREWQSRSDLDTPSASIETEIALAAAPAREESIEDRLPALDLGPPVPPTTPEGLPPLTNAAQWRRPVSLLALLARLHDFPPTAEWAARTTADVQRLTSSEVLDAPQRRELLARLQAAAPTLETLLEPLDVPQHITLARRAGYALTRRVAVWSAALEVEEQQALASGPTIAPEHLTQCMAEVDQLMQGAAGEGWRAYLMLEALNQLAQSQPASLSSDQRSLARRVVERLDRARHMPEQQRFVSQGPLAALELQLRHWTVEPIDTSLLLARLEQYEETGEASLGEAVAEDLNRLAYSPHAEHQLLARRVEDHYRNCNLRVAVTRDMLQRFLPPQEPVEAPVRDVIQGVPVRGCSTTTNVLSLKLLPNSERLRLEISATGLVHSTTTSQRGSVAFNSRSESTYVARKVLEFGARRIDSQPAVAEAETNSRLRSVQSDFDNVPLIGSLVQDYATDRYRERREAARHEVQGKVAAQARHKLDTLSIEGFGAVHQRFLDQVMTPLDTMGLVPSYSESRTEEKRFTLRTRLAAREQLAAHTPRPRALADCLMSAQVHESAANNVLDQMGLNGMSFTADALRRHLVEQFNRTKPLEPSSADDYVVTFAPRDAVRVRFHEGRIELAVSITLLESGSRSWENFTVYANYKPQVVGPGVELVRDGTIGLDGQRLGMQSQFVLRGTFGRIFSEERRITWLADWLRDDPRLAGLGISQCVIEDGWLGLCIGPQ